jgi:hypothetical protein
MIELKQMLSSIADEIKDERITPVEHPMDTPL